jgi:hypothetical protein
LLLEKGEEMEAIGERRGRGRGGAEEAGEFSWRIGRVEDDVCADNSSEGDVVLSEFASLAE